MLQRRKKEHIGIGISMTDFTKTLNDIERIKEIITKREKLVEKNNLELSQKVKNIIDICKPACEKAIERYNATNPLYTIVTSSMGVSFSAKKRTLSLSVRLRYPSGGEPDEEFEDKDVIKIQSKLRPFIDEGLRQAQVPFTFETLAVPIDYYLR